MVFFLVVAILLSGCHAAPQGDEQIGDSADELRGVWVSYLDIDPLLKGADIPTAKARLEEMLNTCRDKGMNTVFFHVRAHGDAYYPSAVFPPAETAAALLADGFDPLAYAVDAAHKRDLAIHAWINPYRIGEDKATAAVDDEQALFEQDGVWYYNPASVVAQQRVLDGVREILDGYAVDGIHFDDYFYPSNMPTHAAPFENVPDTMAVGDWRRLQVDTLVSAVYGLVHARGRVFGISPTALIHNNRENAYADVALWMERAGYIDYICPQIYFGFDHTNHPYAETLAQWEALPRRQGVALYIGLALYKAGEQDTYAADGINEWCVYDDIIARQVQALRKSGAASGFVLFRYAHLSAATKEMQHLQERL